MALYWWIPHITVSVSFALHPDGSQHIARQWIPGNTVDYGYAFVDYPSHDYGILTFDLAMEKYLPAGCGIVLNL